MAIIMEDFVRGPGGEGEEMRCKGKGGNDRERIGEGGGEGEEEGVGAGEGGKKKGGGVCKIVTFVVVVKSHLYFPIPVGLQKATGS